MIILMWSRNLLRINSEPNMKYKNKRICMNTMHHTASPGQVMLDSLVTDQYSVSPQFHLRKLKGVTAYMAIPCCPITLN